MSESTSTILKIITALTSFKISLKFITIGGGWFFLPLAIGTFELPVDKGASNNEFIMVLITLGIGSMIGEIIYFILNLIKRYTFDKINTIKQNKLIELKKKKEFGKVLAEFLETYQHFDMRTKYILMELSRDQKCLLHDPEGQEIIQCLLDNGYIRYSARISEYEGLYRLHPALKEFLSSELTNEVTTAEKTFTECGKPCKKQLLELFSCTKKVISTNQIQEIKGYCELHNKIFSCYEYHEDGDWEKPVKSLRVSISTRYREFIKREYSLEKDSAEIMFQQT